MNQKRFWFVFGILIGIALIIFFVISRSNPHISRENNLSTSTVYNAPKNIGGEIPGVYTSIVPPDLTSFKTSDTAVPAAPNRDEKLRLFAMQVSSAGYNPSQLAIQSGDLIHFTLTALDGNYDFFVPANNIYTFVKRGETKEISFGFGAGVSGTFTFECRDYCPAGKQIKGTLIVTPK